MEEETHFTQTQLPLLSHTAVQGSRAAALGSYSLFLSSRIALLFSTTLSFALTNHASFISIQDISSTMAAHRLIHLSMVGATTIDKW
jgi:hypothetical protein